MRERYIPVQGTAEAETAKAFLLKPAIFDLDGVEERHMQLWVPKAHIHEDSLDDIAEVVKGEDIEINVADWFLREQ